MDSLKKCIITIFSNMPSIDGLEKNKVMLVTAAGIIYGTPAVLDDDLNDPANLLCKSVKTFADAYREHNNIPDNTFLDGNDGAVTLKDVTICSENFKINTPFLCVFFDQIIGVSLGNID